MNERIKELFEECVYEKEFGFDVEMFAQLIVRECVEVSKQYNFHERTNIAVLEHFGMKESDWK